jgi:prepilin-type N-terminal cleavage/methylation domain-containing protein
MTRLRAAAQDDEAGFSLVEILVSLTVMSVVMVVFTTAVLQIYGNSGTAESIATTRSQLNLAFQRFDRELRYASWIATPGKVGTAWYVEFASSDAKECLQLETAPAIVKDNDTDGLGVLQLIRWTPGSPPAKNRPGQTIASQLVTDAEGPFELAPANVSSTDDPSYTPDLAALRVRLTARAGRNSATVNATFTALNTSRNTPTTHVCSEGRPT